MKKEANLFYTLLAIITSLIGLQYYYGVLRLLSGYKDDWISRFMLSSGNELGLIMRPAFLSLFFITCYLYRKYSEQSILRDVSNLTKFCLWFALLPTGTFFVFVTDLPFTAVNYPLSFILVIANIIFVTDTIHIGKNLKDDFNIKTDSVPIIKPGGFVIPLEDNKFINIPTPNAGISVIGSAGSGKTESVAYPLIEQTVSSIEQCSLTYDYKFPTLATKIYHELTISTQKVHPFWVLNFMDMSRTHRTNIFHPSLIEQVTFASQYARSLINNLMPESIKNPDFWIRSSTALLAGTIWYLRKNFPDYCTCPHVISLISNGDTIELVKLLMSDEETDGLVSSIQSAIDRKADAQISGVLSTLQTAFAAINTKNIFWVLSGDDFLMDINDPNSPKHVVIGNDTQVPEALSPIISCIMTVALNKLNREGKNRSVVLIDEAAQLYIPGFPNIPAVCRSNKMAIVCLAQSISQYENMYGKEGSQTLMDNLNTQIYGRTRSTATAKYVSELFDKEDKVTMSQNSSVNSSLGGGGNSLSRNESYQQRNLVRPKDVLTLKTGEFYGMTIDTVHPYFYGKVKRDNVDKAMDKIPSFSHKVTEDMILANYRRIRREAAAILDGTIKPN